MVEFALILPLGLAALPLLLVGGRRAGSAVGHWLLAGILLWLTGLGLALSDRFPPLLVLGHLVAPVSASLLLQGALRFTRRAARPGIHVVGSIGAALVGAAFYGIGRNAAVAIAIATSVPLLVAAGATVFAHARRSRAAAAELALGPVLFLLALIMPADILLRARFDETTSLVPIWGTLAFSIAFLTLAALTERQAKQSDQLRSERELLRRVALVLADTRDPRSALGRLSSEIRESGALRFFGIWTLDADGNHLERLDAGDSPPRHERLRRIPVSLPPIRDLLASSHPRPFDELVHDLRLNPESSWSRAGPGFAAPLRSRGRLLGLLAVALPRHESAEEHARRFVADLADEIALVLDSIALAQGERDHQRELEVERRTLRALVESSPLGILLTDRRGHIRVMNGEMAAIAGIDPPHKWLGRPASALFIEVEDRLHAESRALLEGFLPEANRPGEVEIPGCDVTLERGSTRTLRLVVRPVRARDEQILGQVWLARDVTEERQVAERLEFAHRMETLGTLTGGLAHDFNNQLTAILASVHALLDELPSGAGLHETGRRVELAVEHCADLTRGLLTLSRRHAPTFASVDLARLIDEVVVLLRPTLPPEIEIDVEIATNVGWLPADRSELRRAITNLVLNARDAVGEHGRIRVRAMRRVLADEAPCVAVCVADDGAGMDDATRERIFEPFFTTKGSGKGTGLGLAVVQRVADAHGARIEVESSPGRGSEIRLLWPASRLRATASDPAA